MGSEADTYTRKMNSTRRKRVTTKKKSRQQNMRGQRQGGEIGEITEGDEEPDREASKVEEDERVEWKVGRAIERDAGKRER